MGFDALLVSMENRADREIALQVPKRLLDRDELDVVLPECCRIVAGQVSERAGAKGNFRFGST